MRILELYGTFLLSASFAVFSGASLQKHGGQIRHTKGRTLKCAQSCECRNLQALCTSGNLTMVPAEFSSLTQNINLSHNNILTLSNDSFFNLYALSYLYADHNRIKILQPNTFFNNHQLKVLHLQRNELSSLPVDIFQHSPNLVDINLSHNKLSQIDVKTFVASFKLLSLNMSSNQLTDIPNGTFSDLIILKRLDLSHNPLSSYKLSRLSKLSSLRHLMLSHCGLRFLPVDMFDNLQHLFHLDVSHNGISHIPRQTFLQPSSLSQLLIHDNPLHCDCSLTGLLSWIQTHQDSFTFTRDNIPRCYKPDSIIGTEVKLIVNLLQRCAKIPIDRLTYLQQEKNKNRRSTAPLKYDRMLGWYTAATLLGMLFLFLLYVVLDKFWRRFKRQRRYKRDLKKDKSQTESSQTNVNRFNTSNVNGKPVYATGIFESLDRDDVISLTEHIIGYNKPKLIRTFRPVTPLLSVHTIDHIESDDDLTTIFGSRPRVLNCTDVRFTPTPDMTDKELLHPLTLAISREKCETVL